VIRLHDYILSAECYQVRLLLSMLGLPYEPVKVNVHPGQEHREAAFLALNPLGCIPVLTDDDWVFRDPGAILTYLALRYDPARRWYPAAPGVAAQVQRWVGFDVTALSAARMANLTGREGDPAVFRRAGEAALAVLEDHLAACALDGRGWVAADHATIADLALFPTVAMAPEGGFSLDTTPYIWRWVERLKRLPGFVVMPGVLPILV
jgi:glutathione S-transferase